MKRPVRVPQRVPAQMFSATFGDFLDPLRKPGRRKPPVSPPAKNIGEQLLAYCAVAVLIVLVGRSVPLESMLLMGGTFAAALAEMRGIRVGASSPRPSGLPFAFILIPAICIAKISLYPTFPHVASAGTLDSAYWRLILDLSLAFGAITITSCFFKEAPLYEGAWLAGLANVVIWVFFLQRVRPEVDVVLTATPLCIFYVTLASLSHRLARSFSLGEAMLIAQAVALFSAELIFTLAGRYWPEQYLAFYLRRVTRPSADLFLQSLFFASCATAALLVAGRHSKSIFFLLSSPFVFVATMAVWHYWVNLPLLWLWHAHLSNSPQLLMSLYWALLLLFTLLALVLVHLVAPSLRFDFGARKLFHVLALALFIPGTWLNASYLRVAQAAAFALMLLLELALGSRLLANSAARKFLLHFRDEQDTPELLLTHIYLLAGCALPLWLESSPDAHSVRLYAGLLVLGIADSAASLVGRAIGRLKWPARRRTVEGSLAAVLAPLGVLYLAATVTDSEWDVPTWKRIAGACGALALLEAFSSHVDNLVLTPAMYAVLTIALPRLRLEHVDVKLFGLWD